MRMNRTAKILLLISMLYSLQVVGAPTEDTQLGWFNEARVRSLSQFQGLSSAKITCLLKDRKGYVWIGTSNGLNRYDGTSMTLFMHNPENANSIGSNAIASLYEDKYGHLWVGTKDGLYTFNYKNQSFSRQIIDSKEKDHITSMTEDKDGNLWIGNIYGLIKYNHEKQTFQLTDFTDKQNDEKTNFAIKIIADRQGELWIGTWNHGIYRMNPLTGAYKKFIVPGYEKSEPFTTGSVTTIEEGPDGSLWFGCWGYGLLRIFPDRQQVTWYKHDMDNPNSLNGNEVKSLAFDASGYLWIGMEESGLDRLAPESENFTHYFVEFQSSDIYEGKGVYSLMIDDQALMWLGFRNDGVKIVPLSNTVFENYQTMDQPYSKVFSICEMPQGIYTGSRGAVDKFDLKIGKHLTYPLPTGETPISMYRFTDQSMLLGTYMGSIFEFNTESGRFAQIGNDALQKELYDQKIECFFKVSDSEILIGAKKALYRLNLEDYRFKTVINDWSHAIHEGNAKSVWIMSWSDFYQYFPETGKLIKHSTEAKGDVKTELLMSNDETVYLGTDLGFYSQNLKTGELQLFKDIFPYLNNQVNAIVADNQNHLWLTSESELIYYNPQQNKFKTFNEEDGLPNMRFYDGVGIKLENGSIAFGGEGGMLIFDPLKIEDKGNKANLTFTKMSILNEMQKRRDRAFPNDRDISEMDEIYLQYRQNIITFHFALLSYVNPSKHRYQYLLEGFNEQWFDLGNQNAVTFTNLDPGEYTLKIRAANEENNWGPTKELRIHVRPPIYQTWYAYVLYMLMLASVYLFIRQFYKNKEKLKSRLKDEHMRFEKMKAKARHESDFSQMRLKFFTNISHEFRTPLTLILGPLENFVKNQKWPTEEHLRLMHKNAERLQRLITQILDFRSMESKSLKFEPSWGDVVRFIKETAQLFAPMAQQKSLSFKILDPSGGLMAWFDRDKLEKIIYNLLSNAFKHTQNGEVSIEMEIYTKTSVPYQSKRWAMDEYEQFIEIIVKDSGNGIPEDKIPNIFDRFFHLHTNNSSNVQGTGIGLALTKELVNMHNGKIFVRSKLNEGSTFHVIIPLKTVNAEEDQRLENNIQSNPDAENVSLSMDHKYHKLPIRAEQNLPNVLIVEDNEDLREYMRVEFAQYFDLLEAENGKKGLEKAFEFIPDLIISDLIMPEMDGIEFCKEIKNDARTSHIPIIILTAHGSHIDKVRGYEIGADDYITKPFSSDLLLLRIENLLKNRKELQTKFSREVRLQPKDLPISNMDERFLTKAMEVVEENLNNSDFNADSFASEMCMSRVHLYRKLKALTDQSVSDFVKTARLKLAANLIGENKLTIKEAAYTVGFKDPKYFSKCFKQQFGVKPSDYHEDAVVKEQ